MNGLLLIFYIKHFYTSDPLFCARNKSEFMDMYYSPELGIEKLFELIFFQFKRTKMLREFLSECYRVCNKINGKQLQFLLWEIVMPVKLYLLIA